LPLLGAHMSIADGLHLAFDRLRKVRGDALQIFTANQRQWNHHGPSIQDIEMFRARWEEADHIPVAAHDSYLINLAASDDNLVVRSIEAFVRELRRCAALGIHFLIMHPGAHVGSGLERGLQSLVKNLDRAIEQAAVDSVEVLIENTAGQGSSLGASFEEIAHILTTSRFGGVMGVCFDTCHGFAAGYDIRSAHAYEATVSRFDSLIGLDRIKFFHLNDSKRELGSRVDRHEHIGKGKIGLEGFRLLLNDPRFRQRPMTIETPKGKGLKEDAQNLRTLRSLLEP